MGIVSSIRGLYSRQGRIAIYGVIIRGSYSSIRGAVLIVACTLYTSGY